MILFRGVSGYPKLDGAFYIAKTCPLATYAPVISKTWQTPVIDNPKIRGGKWGNSNVNGFDMKKEMPLTLFLI